MGNTVQYQVFVVAKDNTSRLLPSIDEVWEDIDDAKEVFAALETTEQYKKILLIAHSNEGKKILATYDITKNKVSSGLVPTVVEFPASIQAEHGVYNPISFIGSLVPKNDKQT